MSRNQYLLITALVVLTAGTRMIQHPWNIAPLGALALFAGAHFGDRRWAFVTPLLALVVSDIALGAMHRNFAFWTFHPLILVSALCYVGSVGLGIIVRRSWRSSDRREAHAGENPVGRFQHAIARIVPVVGATLAGGALFFLVTNFGVWVVYPTYPHTFGGLMDCYVKALPFYRNTMISDAFYVSVMFAGYAVCRHVFEPSEESGLQAEIR